MPDQRVPSPSDPRARRARTRLTALLGVCALVIAGLGLAQAAQLGVSGSTVSTSSDSHPCPGPATATAADGSGATFSGAVVTLGPACEGKTVALAMTNGPTVLTGSGVADATGTAPITFSPASTYDATLAWSATATVEGWHQQVTWSFDGPPPPTGPITAGSSTTSLTVLGWSSTSVNQVCASVRVSSTTPGVRWRLHVNVAFAPWDGRTTGYNLNGASATVGAFSAGVVPVDEGSWTNPAGAEQVFQVCNSNLGPPAVSTVVQQGNGDTLPNAGGWYRDVQLRVCVDLAVRATNGNKSWAVDVNTNGEPFDGVAPLLSGDAAPHLQVAPATGRPAGWLRVTGTGAYTSVHAFQRDPIRFTLCAG